MKRNPRLDFGQWMVVVCTVACVAASWSRLVSHQLWQDVVILISGAVIGLFGLLLAFNWRGLTDRYSSPSRPLSPKKMLHSRQSLIMRVSGALLTVPAFVAIGSSISWLILLLTQ